MLRQCARVCTALFVLLVYALGLLTSRPVSAQVQGPIYTADVRGTMTGATIEYLRGALRQAESSNATALIVQLENGGGVLRDVRPFAGEIAAANVPVVVFVAPAGTRAGPAATLLLSAAHVNALAPNASFGSAYPLTRVDDVLTQQTRDLVLDSVVDQLHDWNKQRGRNTDWLDRAVRDGAILTSEQAVALNPPAIDVVASDQQQLLTLLENRTVQLESGQKVTLSTLGRGTVPIEPTLWQSIRLTLAEPTIAFALLIVGALAVYLELAAPGTSVFAGAGLVLVVAAFIGLLALPVQPWALALLMLALVMLGGEFFMPVHGALAVIGLVLMVVAGLNLIDPAQAPDTEVAPWAIVGIAGVLATVVALGVLLAIRVRRRPVTTGQEGLIGKLAEVRQPLMPEGMVYVEGALWRAISEDGEAGKGEHVRVVAIHNLQLVVQRLETADA